MNKALLATDGSEASLRAARALGKLARRDPELQVTVLHVVPIADVIMPVAAADAPLTAPYRLEEYMERRMREVLTVTLDLLDLPERQVTATHVIGNPADAILQQTHDGAFDMIVMGRRGRSPLKELLLGSVSQAVIHRAHCPIYLVP